MTDQTPIIAPSTRHDGWTGARVTQFLDHLATDGSVRAACGRVGMSREAAYKLRRRDAVFARAWNAALVLAREAAAEVLENRAIHGVEEQIWFRGELVGTRRKFDSRLLLAHMSRLDRVAEDERAGEDAARFDELLAILGGETVPEALVIDGDELPLPRDEAIEIARVAAVDDWEDTPKRERVGGCYDAADRAAAQTAAHCDEWLFSARAAVDRLLDAPSRESGANTLSELSTSPEEAVSTAPPANGYLAWKARHCGAGR